MYPDYQQHLQDACRRWSERHPGEGNLAKVLQAQAALEAAGKALLSARRHDEQQRATSARSRSDQSGFELVQRLCATMFESDPVLERQLEEQRATIFRTDRPATSGHFPALRAIPDADVLGFRNELGEHLLRFTTTAMSLVAAGKIPFSVDEQGRYDEGTQQIMQAFGIVDADGHDAARRYVMGELREAVVHVASGMLDLAAHRVGSALVQFTGLSGAGDASGQQRRHLVSAAGRFLLQENANLADRQQRHGLVIDHGARIRQILSSIGLADNTQQASGTSSSRTETSSDLTSKLDQYPSPARPTPRHGALFDELRRRLNGTLDPTMQELEDIAAVLGMMRYAPSPPNRDERRWSIKLLRLEGEWLAILRVAIQDAGLADVDISGLLDDQPRSSTLPAQNVYLEPLLVNARSIAEGSFDFLFTRTSEYMVNLAAAKRTELDSKRSALLFDWAMTTLMKTSPDTVAAWMNANISGPDDLERVIDALEEATEATAFSPFETTGLSPFETVDKRLRTIRSTMIGGAELTVQHHVGRMLGELDLPALRRPGTSQQFLKKVAMHPDRGIPVARTLALLDVLEELHGRPIPARQRQRIGSHLSPYGAFLHTWLQDQDRHITRLPQLDEVLKRMHSVASDVSALRAAVEQDPNRSTRTVKRLELAELLVADCATTLFGARAVEAAAESVRGILSKDAMANGPLGEIGTMGAFPFSTHPAPEAVIDLAHRAVAAAEQVHDEAVDLRLKVRSQTNGSRDPGSPSDPSSDLLLRVVGLRELAADAQLARLSVEAARSLGLLADAMPPGAPALDDSSTAPRLRQAIIQACHSAVEHLGTSNSSSIVSVVRQILDEGRQPKDRWLPSATGFSALRYDPEVQPSPLDRVAPTAEMSGMTPRPRSTSPVASDSGAQLDRAIEALLTRTRHPASTTHVAPHLYQLLCGRLTEPRSRRQSFGSDGHEPRSDKGDRGRDRRPDEDRSSDEGRDDDGPSDEGRGGSQPPPRRPPGGRPGAPAQPSPPQHEQPLSRPLKRSIGPAGSSPIGNRDDPSRSGPAESAQPRGGLATSVRNIPAAVGPPPAPASPGRTAPPANGLPSGSGRRRTVTMSAPPPVQVTAPRAGMPGGDRFGPPRNTPTQLAHPAPPPAMQESSRRAVTQRGVTSSPGTSDETKQRGSRLARPQRPTQRGEHTPPTARPRPLDR